MGGSVVPDERGRGISENSLCRCGWCARASRSRSPEAINGRAPVGHRDRSRWIIQETSFARVCRICSATARPLHKETRKRRERGETRTPRNAWRAVTRSPAPSAPLYPLTMLRLPSIGHPLLRESSCNAPTITIRNFVPPPPLHPPVSRRVVRRGIKNYWRSDRSDPIEVLISRISRWLFHLLTGG